MQIIVLKTKTKEIEYFQQKVVDPDCIHTRILQWDFQYGERSSEKVRSNGIFKLYKKLIFSHLF